jgi:phage N-6-adenine-methyltransferase
VVVLVSLKGFRSRNHPQQTAQRGASLFPELADLTDEGDDRGTDPALFAALNERFGFTLDVAASHENAKCARYYTRDDDGLARPWGRERVWCNPPYSQIRPWIQKAWNERYMMLVPELVVMLLPANRTEQSWWQELVEPHRDRGGPLRVEFLPGRPRFVQRPGLTAAKGDRPPFGCCLLIWNVA